jgi:hypothetical protein
MAHLADLICLHDSRDVEAIKALLKASSADVRARLESGRIQQSTISQKLVSLDARLGSVFLSSEIVPGQLQTIIESMKQATEAMKTTAILQNLHFPSMNERFRNVRESAPDTFRWIFEDPSRLLSAEHELDISFPEWLRSGSGIFHIAGKPGSGKSTLMKFICEHEEVVPLLREWGGSREVISAKFFFWRIGSVDEKSLGGLIRGLLFATIQQEPDLAQLLFPRFWKSDTRSLGFSPFIDLTDREISNAFNEMTQNDALLEKFRMCFFVDGLDELEPTESATHYTLTQKIWEWASKSKGNVKFCVASREMPVFEGAFPANQRITIQTFTTNDIEKLVRQRLEDNALFQNMKGKHESKCEELMGKIIREAEGVFLWVVLLLTQFEESLANGDSIAMLERILKKAPKELDEFFLSILDSIPERYRESASTIMAVAMRVGGILLSNQKREPKYEKMDLSMAQFPRMVVGLVGCSFLFEASDRGDLSDLPADFPQYGGEDELEARLKSARSQLKARCRGLLAYQGTRFLFTHRSIPEFLQRTLNQKERSYQIDDHLVAERFVWMLLSELKYGFRCGTWIAPKEEYSPTDRVMTLTRIFRQTTWESLPRAFHLFRMIDDELLCEKLGTTNVPDKECNYGLLQDYATGLLEYRGGVLSIAASHGLHEYVTWELTTNTHLKKARYYGINALASCVGFENGFNTLFHGDTLDALFRGGAPVDAAYPKYGEKIGDKNILLWHHWLVCYLFTDPAFTGQPSKKLWLKKLPDYVWRNIEIWLRHGADPDLTLSLVLPHAEISMHWTGGEVWSFYLPSDREDLKEGEISVSAVKSLFESSEMSITLEEFIKFRNPSGSGGIIQLMQRNRRLKEEAASKAAKTAETPPVKSDAEAELAGVIAHTGITNGQELVVHNKSQTVSYLLGFWTHPAVWVSLSRCSTSLTQRSRADKHIRHSLGSPASILYQTSPSRSALVSSRLRDSEN